MTLTCRPDEGSICELYQRNIYNRRADRPIEVQNEERSVATAA